MKKRILLFGSLVVAVGAIWFTYLAVRAHSNLVTLNVRNEDVRKVARMISWQTWEIIMVPKDVEGQVTFNVRKAPLEDVLNIISEQIGARWSALYPLYSSSRSLKAFKQAVRGELHPEEHGWTNLTVRPPRFLGMFAEVLRSQNNQVSVVLENKDLSVATLALARFAQAQVVPEDGTVGTINLTLNNVAMPDAVARLAKQVKRNWSVYYAFHAFRGDRRPEWAGGRGPRPDERTATEAAATNAPLAEPPMFPPDGPPRFGRRWGREVGTNELDTNRPWGPPPEMMAAFQQQLETQLETMTPEQRERVQEMRQRFEDMRNLSPEERRQRMSEMFASPEFQQRMQNRMMSGLKNTTPEQRVERDRRRLEWRQRREGQPGPPRP